MKENSIKSDTLSHRLYLFSFTTLFFVVNPWLFITIAFQIFTGESPFSFFVDSVAIALFFVSFCVSCWFDYKYKADEASDDGKLTDGRYKAAKLMLLNISSGLVMFLVKIVNVYF